MLYGSPRGAERIYIKDGIARDGRILARHIRSYFDAGAYTRLSSYAAIKCTAHLPGPYTIPNVASDIYVAYTNRCPSTAMRGFGITAVDFALEVHMDKGAEACGMDPMEFRILNAYRDGDMKAHRRVAKNTALIECVQVAAEKARWPSRKRRSASLRSPAVAGRARKSRRRRLTRMAASTGRKRAMAGPRKRSRRNHAHSHDEAADHGRLDRQSREAARRSAIRALSACRRAPPPAYQPPQTPAPAPLPPGTCGARLAAWRASLFLDFRHAEALRWLVSGGAAWRPSITRSA